MTRISGLMILKMRLKEGMMDTELRKQFIKMRARVIARARVESKKQNISLMSLLFGREWQRKWRAK